MEALRGKAALVVDSHAINRRIVADMLGQWGFRVTEAADADAGLAAVARARSEGAAFALVLTEAEAPLLDGFALCERIKADPANDATALIVLSAAGRPGDGARCRALGIRGYLTKPIARDELLDTVLAAIGVRPTPGAPPALVTRHALRERRQRLRILVVEDNPVNQRLAARLVERQGHEAVVVETGRAALEALERERFDLVLMDLQMPDMDGLAAVGAIRDREARRAAGSWTPPPGSSFAAGGRLPVVAVTAHAMPGDEARARAAGMDDYVTKPIQPAALAATIDGHVDREPLPAREAAGPAPVDLEVARRLAAGDEALRAEIAALFVESCGRRRAELREALDARDGARVGRVAHALRGAAASVGATAAQALSGELEALSPSGDADRIADLGMRLDRELDRAVEFLVAQAPVKSG